MPKMKPHSGAAKRFKNGKYRGAKRRHNTGLKSTKWKRCARGARQLVGATKVLVERMLRGG